MNTNDTFKPGLRCAYLVNQYPKVSHAFIRREVLALERRGVSVARFAVRGWDAQVLDPQDLAEQRQTRYLLQGGLLPLMGAALRQAVLSPRRYAAAWCMAWHMGGRGAERPRAYHLLYLAQACLLLGWLKGAGVQHVHAHFGTNSAEVALLTHALGGPAYSFTVHGPEEFDKPLAIGLGHKIRHAAFVVVISSFGRSQLYRWVGAEHWPKIHVVRCGVEAAFYAGVCPPVPDVPVLVCVGRLCEQKGQILLIEALARVVASGREVQLVLAGDGEMRGEIEAATARHGLQARVRITGWISSEQVRTHILAARVMILPSFAEGLPVVLMEALSLGRPVIATAVAGIPELVKPGLNGWLCEAGSVDALVQAMQECLAMPSEHLARMGQAGHERVCTHHDVDLEAARLADLFAQAVNRRTARAPGLNTYPSETES